DINVGGLKISVVVENREALVRPVAYVHVTLVIHLNRVNILELPVILAPRTKRFYEIAVLVELHDSFVVVAVGNKNVTRLVPGDVSLAVKRGERTHIENFAP